MMPTLWDDRPPWGAAASLSEVPIWPHRNTVDVGFIALRPLESLLSANLGRV